MKFRIIDFNFVDRYYYFSYNNRPEFSFKHFILKYNYNRYWDEETLTAGIIRLEEV